MGLALRAYLAISPLIGLIAPILLRRRVARGREDPVRHAEKLGHPSAPRPGGRVVWLHAVGLGEVLALRGLIAAMARQQPELSFLVTSSARSSGHVMGANLPPATLHQFLPLDAPAFVARFLDHWRPDLSVWAEQEIWPGAVVAAHARGVPLALVNARLTEAGAARRGRARGLYRDLFARFALIAAQDADSAARLSDLGAQAVRVTGSLKVAAPPLMADPAHLAAAQAACAGRKVWTAASTHPEDEAQALAAQRILWAADPQWLLILAPRDPARAAQIAQGLAGLPPALRSAGQVPGAGDAVWLADSYGELGLWYRLAGAALVGGAFGPVGGHNPWEAAQLGAAILHGPNVQNFRGDYAALHHAGAAHEVPSGALADALTDPDLPAMAGRAQALVAAQAGALDPLAADLLGLMAGDKA